MTSARRHTGAGCSLMRREPWGQGLGEALLRSRCQCSLTSIYYLIGTEGATNDRELSVGRTVGGAGCVSEAWDAVQATVCCRCLCSGQENKGSDVVTWHRMSSVANHRMADGMKVCNCVNVAFLSIDIVDVSCTDSEIAGVCWLFWKQGKGEINIFVTFLLDRERERERSFFLLSLTLTL